MLDKYNKGIYIKKNAMIHKKNSFDTRTYSFSELKEFEINKELIVNLFDYLWVAYIVVGFFYYIVFFIGKLDGVPDMLLFFTNRFGEYDLLILTTY